MKLLSNERIAYSSATFLDNLVISRWTRGWFCVCVCVGSCNGLFNVRDGITQELMK